MPKGSAYLYTTTSKERLFKNIRECFEGIGIQLEYPGTHKVQMWDLNGDMVQIDADRIDLFFPVIDDYLVQFWWREKEDISLRINCGQYLNEVCLYLDGLDNSQLNQIGYVLGVLTIDSNISGEIAGFVVDRHELTSEFNWYDFFSSATRSIDFLERTTNFRVIEAFWTQKDERLQINEVDENNVYIAIREPNDYGFSFSIIKVY
jgi:hypothetical protein